MNDHPPSQYPGQNPPEQPGYPQPGEFSQPGYQQTQPGYPPQQPGYIQPPAPRKRQTGLWIALIAILLLAAGSGGAYYYFQVRSTPQKALQAYCDGFKNNDAQAIYNTLSTASQSQTSVNKIQLGLRLFMFVTGGIKDCAVDSSSIQENGSIATGDITLVANSGRSMNSTIHLIDENGQWKIENSSNLPQ